ncbi:MAG: hypothetical protein ACTSYE_01655 [Alphaproteobacteria bacterium]
MARMDFGYAEAALIGEEKPNAADLFDLGIMCATGEDAETDLVSAHKWFNLAALAGNDEAALHRQDLAIEMSTVEIAAAQRTAREWLSTH